MEGEVKVGVELNRCGLNKELYSAEGMDKPDFEEAFNSLLFRCLTAIRDMNDIGGNSIEFVIGRDIPENDEMVCKLYKFLVEEGGFSLPIYLAGTGVLKVSW